MSADARADAPNRLDAAVARIRGEGRGAFSAYLCAGHPDLATSEAMMAAAVEGGADWLEFGIPFSDPAADGPVIQKATADALRAGATVQDCLAVARRLRDRFPDTPLVAMTYANLAHRLGWTAWAESLAAAGIDACILPDVPLEESGPARAALAEASLLWVPLVTPTTPPERMATVAATATGFLYVVGAVGITGQAGPGPLVEATVQRARAAGATVPLVVGFGIAGPEDVRRVLAAGADGAIVGSHLVRMVDGGCTPDALRDEVRRLAGGARRAPAETPA